MSFLNNGKRIFNITMLLILEGRKNMKKKVLAALFSIAIAFCGIAGFTSTVHADNDKYSYSFYNGYSSGASAGKAKTSDKKVYVHQMSGPGLKYRVQGSHSGTTWANRSAQETMYNGYTRKIENSVHSHSEGIARLQFVRITTAPTNTTGYWNPEPT